MVVQEKQLHTLISLDEFKSILGVDDRDDKIARFCLVTSTLSIEQYCMRRLLYKKHFERIDFFGDLLLPMREYPVTSILTVYANGEIVEPEFYGIVPDCGTDEDIPFNLLLSPAFTRYRGLSAIKAVYWAGYANGKVPPDLAAACMELAAWNFNRYKGRRVGMAGNIRGAGQDKEHFEPAMPENVRRLLEPYKRKTI